MQKQTITKSDIRAYVKDMIIGKIANLEKFLDFTLEASREIKKAPKYDSIRTEMQEEIYQMQKQLGALNMLRLNLNKVLNTPTERVQIGSIVITNKAEIDILFHRQIH